MRSCTPITQLPSFLRSPGGGRSSGADWSWSVTRYEAPASHRVCQIIFIGALETKGRQELQKFCGIVFGDEGTTSQELQKFCGIVLHCWCPPALHHSNPSRACPQVRNSLGGFANSALQEWHIGRGNQRLGRLHLGFKEQQRFQEGIGITEIVIISQPHARAELTSCSVCDRR